jgi:hypothetical protein
MQPSKRSERPAPLHECPICRHPQTKIQRLLSGAANGSTTYVCARFGACSVGIDLDKVKTWVAV